MHVYLHINDHVSVKRGLNASAKSIDPGQPADMSRNFLLLVNLLRTKGPYYLFIHLVVNTERRMYKAIT